MAKLNKNKVKAAIAGSAGIISAIAGICGVEWHTAENFIRKNEDLSRLLADEKNKVLDLADSEVIKAIKAGDAQMIRWYLSTQGKHRGYTSEINVKADISEKITFVDKLDE